MTLRQKKTAAFVVFVCFTLLFTSAYDATVSAERTMRRRRRGAAGEEEGTHEGTGGMDDILSEIEQELSMEEEQQQEEREPPKRRSQGRRVGRKYGTSAKTLFDENEGDEGNNLEGERHDDNQFEESADSELDRRNVAAIELAKAGRLQAALEEFKEIVELDPEALSVWNNLGVTYLRLGLLKDSYDALVEVLKKDARNEDAIANFKELCPFMDLNADVEFVKLGYPFLSSLPREEKAKIRQQVKEEQEEREKKTRKLQRRGAKKPAEMQDSSQADENDDSPTPRSEARPVDNKVTGQFGRAEIKVEHNVRELPRVPVDRLYLPENRVYAEGKKPFILTGLVNKWDTRKKWTATYLAERFPDSIADFYSQNMDVQGTHPFLLPLPRALQNLFHPEKSKLPKPASRDGRYIQWNVRWDDWQKIKEDMGDIPFFFTKDEPWLEGCLPSDSLRNEFLLSTHWRMVLIGDRGAGMFNHIDTLRTSSFQFQLRGRKLWHICGPDQDDNIRRFDDMEQNMFAPDYEKRPWVRNASCFFDIAEEGEALFYPRDYWHQTENLDTPTIAITGTLVDKNNYDSVSEQLSVDCHKKPLKLIHPSKTLCEYYYNHCFPWWKSAFGDAEANYAHVETAQDLKEAPTSISLKNDKQYDTTWKTEVKKSKVPGEFICQQGSFTEEDLLTETYSYDEFYG